MIQFKKIYLWLSVLLLIVLILGIGVVFYPKDKVRLVDVTNYPDSHVLEQLKQKLMTELKNISFDKQIDIYTGNFISSDIPTVKQPQHTNILLLGSIGNFDVSALKQYDYVFVGTLQLYAFLNSQNQKSYLLSPFIEQKDFLSSHCANAPQNEQCFFVVIGEQPQVTHILDKENIRYEFYPKADKVMAEKLIAQFDNISGIIVNRSNIVDNSIDVAPLFLYAVAHQIPILSDNVLTENGANMQNITLTSLFDDTLGYYTYDSDINDFIQCLDCRLKKSQKAKFILDNLYITDMAVKKIMSVLKDKKEYDVHLNNVVSIIAPIHAGLYNNGDYWLSKDLENALDKKYGHAFTTFALSTAPYLGDASIYIRGTQPLMQNKMTPDSVSLMYLIFPLTAETTAENYARSMKDEFSWIDVAAIASPRVAEQAQTLGLNAYYVPQFTNIEKFFRDYHDEFKSEVLFVGQNDYYRKAAPIIYNAGLPITIYGPKWNGLAKAEYIDNKILRRYYSSAKIVLNDTRPDMRQLGFISNRIYDVTACGSLVISDYIPEIEETYGDCVPMWKTEEELIELVKYYLNPEHEQERLRKAQCAQEITLKNFTSDIVAEKFMQIINDVKKTKGIKP